VHGIINGVGFLSIALGLLQFGLYLYWFHDTSECGFTYRFFVNSRSRHEKVR